MKTVGKQQQKSYQSCQIKENKNKNKNVHLSVEALNTSPSHHSTRMKQADVRRKRDADMHVIGILEEAPQCPGVSPSR